ncbi:MAG TPA: arginine deiminase family protein [Kofleriaceae bacterium]|nr:arginine deiminase family protein [Kofleriaceae bacterium]
MRALVRDVSPSFANALCAVTPDPPIELALAKAQHREYQLALLECGLELRMLGPSDDPDACFVEDTAVVASDVALISRPGAPSRRAETVTVAAALERDVQLVRMDAPATLDGGDVMRVGKTIFVGRSARTNEAGIARLAEVFEPRGFRVVPVAMPAGVLHLKSCCAPLGDDRITLADGSIPADAFGDVHVVRVPVDESYAANCLAVSGSVLCAKGYPRTRDALAAAGFDTVELDTSEFRKADGALTCLSILF